MIGYLTGTVKAVRKNYIILATDHVGYKVFVTPNLSLSLETGKPISLYIHTYVREDQLSLHGFPTLPELEFFELLLTVSGIGPKMALAIMSTDNLESIKSGIVKADPGAFTKVSGVGRKTAERLIVELKEKIHPAEIEKTGSPFASEHADVLDVLMALGYSRTEARSALSQIPAEIESSQDRIREALRSLAKQ